MFHGTRDLRAAMQIEQNQFDVAANPVGNRRESMDRLRGS
jgi:hypothetical protein